MWGKINSCSLCEARHPPWVFHRHQPLSSLALHPLPFISMGLLPCRLSDSWLPGKGSMGGRWRDSGLCRDFSSWALSTASSLGVGASLCLVRSQLPPHPISGLSACSITCLINVWLKSLHYKYPELLLCLGLLPSVSCCAVQLTFAEGHPASQGALGRLSLGAPASRSSLIFLDTMASHPGLHPRTLLIFTTPGTFNFIPSTHCHLTLSFIFVISQKQFLEATNCVLQFFLPQSYHRHLNTILRLSNVEKSQHLVF